LTVKTYNKPVRDRLPEILKANGQKVATTSIEGDELIAALRAKVDEELAEYDAARDTNEAAAELADLIEVIVALARRRGFDETRLGELRREKSAARGGFDLGVYLMTIG
jgi:predicted house-cleaning noncanonical NTP pyrophosphatase (MazG superfamily)